MRSSHACLRPRAALGSWPAPILLAAVTLQLASPARGEAPLDASLAPADLGALLALFAQAPAFEAEFREVKTLSLLSAPLITEGRLHYLAGPPRLVRVVERPAPARVLVTQAEVILQSGTGVQRLDLGTIPEVRALVSSLTSLLAGDRAALEEAYDVRFAASAEQAWTLELTPKSKRLRALVQKLRFAGRGSVVSEFTVEEASGDVSKTAILKPNPKRRYSESEVRELFGMPKR